MKPLAGNVFKVRPSPVLYRIAVETGSLYVFRRHQKMAVKPLRDTTFPSPLRVNYAFSDILARDSRLEYFYARINQKYYLLAEWNNVGGILMPLLKRG
jgi:hypothetical protein